MSESDGWYIVKREDGRCEIVPHPPDPSELANNPDTELQQWGPFTSQAEAIARRVGLIRAGKCQPF